MTENTEVYPYRDINEKCMDPDEVADNELPHLALHCLAFSL